MAKWRILIVDDEEGMLEVCAECLSAIDADIVTELESARAARRLEAESWDLLIADVRMPGVDGVEMLRLAREQDPELAALMITAFANVETAVECMKLGAADYIAKPFLPEDLLASAHRLLEAKRLRDENSLLSRQVGRAHTQGTLVGESEAMQRVFELIDHAGPTGADVLILGETGTGKELVARAIHERSERGDRRFVPVDCGAIPEELMESELFGHERGAFTGANSRSLGLMEFADGGSFFLDEIGELSPRLQAKLLRALQERRIRRVGGKEEVDVDLRIIAATARNLDQDIKDDRFRSDLYYRINVARIELPPLRDRVSDIPLLANHFIERYAGEMGRERVEIAPEAMEILSRYSWPGNVRELQNVIRRALALTRRRQISKRDLPDEMVAAAGGRAGTSRRGFFDRRDEHVAVFEKEYLCYLLRDHGGDVHAAAREARLPRGTLYRLLKKYGLNASDFRD